MELKSDVCWTMKTNYNLDQLKSEEEKTIISYVIISSSDVGGPFWQQIVTGRVQGPHWQGNSMMKLPHSAPLAQDITSCGAGVEGAPPLFYWNWWDPPWTHSLPAAAAEKRKRPPGAPLHLQLLSLSLFLHGLQWTPEHYHGLPTIRVELVLLKF